MKRFIAIDVETASRDPRSVCAIGAVRFESGCEIGSFRSLVHFSGPVRFAGIHGLHVRDLAEAPDWPTVWGRLLQFTNGIREFVAYRAEFDRGAILAMGTAHELRVPSFRFICAAKMLESRFAGYWDLSEAMQLLGLRFPGRRHDPVADARAAAAIVIALTTRSAERGQPG